MKLWKVVVFGIIVLAMVVVIGRWRETQNFGETLDLSSQSRERAVENASAAVVGGWYPPRGEYCLIVAMDRSGSITPAEREKENQIVEEVSERVKGFNILEVCAFAQAYETFGSADTPDGRKEVLSRWRKSLQYKPDREFTNLSVTADNLVRDAVPNIKSGRLAEIIIITDGDNDPPEDQDDDALIASVAANLDGIPEEYRSRLRVHIIEVGNRFRFAGAVEREIFGGRAATLKASDWSEAVAIVEKLQSELQGSFALQSSYDELKIKVPDDRPVTLGPFTLNLTGVALANFNIRLEPADPTIGDQLLGSTMVNQSSPVPFHVGFLEAKDQDQVMFEFRVDPEQGIPKDYFSSQLWQGKDWDFAVVLEPRDNLLPLQDAGTHLEVKMHRDSLVFEDGFRALLWFLGTALALLALVIYLLCRSSSGEDDDDDDEEEDRAEMARVLSGVVEYGGTRVVLSGHEQEIDDCLRFRRESDGVHVMPYATIEVSVGSKPPEILYADTDFLLPQGGEVSVRELRSSRIYAITLNEFAVALTDEEV